MLPLCTLHNRVVDTVPRARSPEGQVHFHHCKGVGVNSTVIILDTRDGPFESETRIRGRTSQRATGSVGVQEN